MGLIGLGFTGLGSRVFVFMCNGPFPPPEPTSMRLALHCPLERGFRVEGLGFTGLGFTGLGLTGLGFTGLGFGAEGLGIRDIPAYRRQGYPHSTASAPSPASAAAPA